ncbi:putative phosphoribosylaminoimidazole-succinocarboxamide synthase [Sesbania bispinosa]|nr:putative phosphoribosylaminoimidazole-succinocarboxamide synthase [Sesbania bispinosa]
MKIKHIANKKNSSSSRDSEEPEIIRNEIVPYTGVLNVQPISIEPPPIQPHFTEPSPIQT